MHGKAMTHLTRLAGIISSINKATELIVKAPKVNSENLDVEFIQYCQKNLVEQNNYIYNFSLIKIDDIVQAETLLR